MRITSMNNDETELIAHILDGHADAYAQLVDRYKTGLYYHCFKIVRDEDSAADIAQEAFIQAYRQLHKYNPKHRFSTWLYMITTRKAIDHVRRTRHRPIAEDELARLPGREPSAEDQVYYQQVLEAIQDLPDRYRRVIEHYYLEDRPIREISDLMHAPAGSIKGWLHRARIKLKETLQ